MVTEPATNLFGPLAALEGFRIKYQKVYVCGVGRGFFADVMQQHKHAISGVTVCPEGLVISTLEGACVCYSSN